MTPQVQEIFWLCRSLNGFVLSARCSVNFDNWFTIPRNDLTSRMFLGAGRLTIASIFSGSGLIPFALTILPKTSTSDLLNSHLSRFKVMFDSANRLKTAFVTFHHESESHHAQTHRQSGKAFQIFFHDFLRLL